LYAFCNVPSLFCSYDSSFLKFVLSLIQFGACMQVDHCWHYACASSSDETMVSKFVWFDASWIWGWWWWTIDFWCSISHST
jgi:hypothetical protein